MRSYLLPLLGCAFVAGCRRDAAPTADAGATAVAVAGSDYKRGWTLFLDHCAECHGDGRRGDGEKKDRTKVPPANLRSPLLLARLSDDDLARTISQGGAFVGKSNSMPSFQKELSERDVMDVVALLRGDELSLTDCFPDASSWVVLTAPEDTEPVLAAYAGVPQPRRPALVKDADLPKDATLVGLVLFTEAPLGRAGVNPVALLVDPSGGLLGVRVGLPRSDRPMAQGDLEAMLRGQDTRPVSLGALPAKLLRLSAVAKAHTR